MADWNPESLQQESVHFRQIQVLLRLLPTAGTNVPQTLERIATHMAEYLRKPIKETGLRSQARYILQDGAHSKSRFLSENAVTKAIQDAVQPRVRQWWLELRGIPINGVDSLMPEPLLPLFQWIEMRLTTPFGEILEKASLAALQRPAKVHPAVGGGDDARGVSGQGGEVETGLAAGTSCGVPASVSVPNLSFPTPIEQMDVPPRLLKRDRPEK